MPFTITCAWGMTKNVFEFYDKKVQLHAIHFVITLEMWKVLVILAIISLRYFCLGLY